MKNVFAVLVDWVNDDGDNGSNVFLFNSIEKARKHLRLEAVSELDNHRGDSVYYDKNENTHLIENLLKELGNSFEVVDYIDTADYAIEVSSDYFCCFKVGEYLCDHITVSIIERSIE
jgi:hypothetical protein